MYMKLIIIGKIENKKWQGRKGYNMLAVLMMGRIYEWSKRMAQDRPNYYCISQYNTKYSTIHLKCVLAQIHFW